MSDYGKRMLRFLRNEEVDKPSNFFIGVVRDISSKGSDNLISHLDTDEYRDLVDNRNVAFITPAHANLSVIEPAFFLNSHEIDLPLIGEAVFCIKTSMGTFIIDRFSINQFALNYDSYDFLLGGAFSNKQISIEYPDGYDEKFHKETINEVAPFNPKEGSKVSLGRNNQYLIFDHGYRNEASLIERENTENGNYVKLGIRKRGNQGDSREDSTLMVMAERASLNHLLTENYQSNLKENKGDEVNNGVGIQSDHFVCIGRYFTVVFSLKDILIEAKEKIFIQSDKLFIKNNHTAIESNMVTIGNNPNQSYVRGENLVSLLKEIISLIRNARYLVSTGGNTVSTDPTFDATLRSFEARYLNTNSPILSKKIKGE